MRTTIVKVGQTELLLDNLLETLSDSAGRISPDDLRAKLALALFHVRSIACDLDDFSTESRYSSDPIGTEAINQLIGTK